MLNMAVHIVTTGHNPTLTCSVRALWTQVMKLTMDLTHYLHVMHLRFPAKLVKQVTDWLADQVTNQPTACKRVLLEKVLGRRSKASPHLWNLKVHYRSHKNLLFVPVLSQIKRRHIYPLLSNQAAVSISLLSPMRATCHTHLILDLATLIIFSDAVFPPSPEASNGCVREDVHKLSTGCQSVVHCMSTRCPQVSELLLQVVPAYPLYVHKLSTGCQSVVHSMSTSCPHDVNQLSTLCPQVVHMMSISCPLMSTRCPQVVHLMSISCPQVVHTM
jgi:hypothetical protein